jgi:hypothetical protein
LLDAPSRTRIRREAAVLQRRFEGLQTPEECIHIRFRIVAGELEEGEFQVELRVSATLHASEGIAHRLD